LFSISSVSVTEPSANTPMSLPSEPEFEVPAVPIVLPLTVPGSVPLVPSSSIAMPVKTDLWMLLLSTVSEVSELPNGLITTPPPSTPEAVVFSVFLESVTLFVPVLAPSLENWN
jgi:hypothetical protein